MKKVKTETWYLLAFAAAFVMNAVLLELTAADTLHVQFGTWGSVTCKTAGRI